MYIKPLREKSIKRCDKKWFELYKDYRKYDNRVVEVLKVDNNAMYMEDLRGGIPLDEIERLRLLPLKTRRFIFEQMFEIYTNQFYFKHKLLSNKQVFIHADFWLKNLMYKNDKVVLIDADSFFATTIGDQNMRFSKFVDSVNVFQYKLF